MRLLLALGALSVSCGSDLVVAHVEPADSDGLVFWLRADRGVQTEDQAVSLWDDQARPGQAAKAVKVTSRPAFQGAPDTVAFDGLDDEMTIPADINGASALTLVLYGQPAAAGGDHIAGDDSAALSWTSGTQAFAEQTFLSSFTDKVVFRFGLDNGQTPTTYIRPKPIAGQASLAIAIKNRDVEALYVDGVRASLEQGRSSTIANAAIQATLGGGRLQTHYGGTITQVMVLRRALSDVERLRLERSFEASR